MDRNEANLKVWAALFLCYLVYKFVNVLLNKVTGQTEKDEPVGDHQSDGVPLEDRFWFLRKIRKIWKKGRWV